MIDPSANYIEKCVIMISHSNYRIRWGGVDKYLYEVTDLLAGRGIHSVQLFPVVEVNNKYQKIGSRKFYIGINVDGQYAGIVEWGKIGAAFERIAEGFRIEGIHIHNLYGWDTERLADLLLKINKPVRIFVHDYVMICRYNMEGDSYLRYCGRKIRKPAEQECEECPYCKEALQEYSKIKGFLTRIQDNIDRIVVPSQLCKEIWGNSYDSIAKPVVVRDHLKLIGEDGQADPIDMLKIGYMGAALDHKGINEWNTLVDKCKGIEGISLFYLGRDNIDNDAVKAIRVDFQDRDTPSMSEALKENKINCVLMWSKCSETYSYTFYEALAAGCFVLTNTFSGNIKASIEKYGNGKSFDTIEEAIRYISDIKAVISDINEYRRNSRIPVSIQPNDSTEELVFSEGTDTYTDRIININTNPVWSFIYRIMRVRRYR